MKPLGTLARRVDRMTPPDRDRAVDALRAFAILGVVLGHWLVTALVGTDGGLHGASPLQHMPWLAPLSWLFQTLALFFFVGGLCGARSHASARARGTGYPAWLRGRLARLARPVTAVLGVWAVVCGIMSASGVDGRTLHTLVTLVVDPLWFLGVFAALTAATPLTARLHPLWPLAVVLSVDLIRFGLGGPAWLGWLNVAAGWLVPHTLGAACARGRLAGRLAGLPLLIGAGAATVALVLWGGYPGSMVGVPGATVSNLNPPTLAAVTFGLAQVGLALLLREPLRRAMRRPMVWAAVAMANLSAMTIFLWHQSAMMAVTAAGLVFGPLPGLHTTPDGPGWILARLCWLPVFALVFAGCRATFRCFVRASGAVRSNSKDPGTSDSGFRNLRRGQPRPTR